MVESNVSVDPPSLLTEIPEPTQPPALAPVHRYPIWVSGGLKGSKINDDLFLFL